VAAVGSACAKHTLQESIFDGPAVYSMCAGKRGLEKERGVLPVRCRACRCCIFDLCWLVLGVGIWDIGPSRSIVFSAVTALKNTGFLVVVNLPRVPRGASGLAGLCGMPGDV